VQVYGGRRRVPGLRREEVARLAGVSVEYYTRLERGNASGASDSVLEALARALQLDDAERAHLFDLVRAANTTARARRRPAQQRVRPAVQQLLDAMADVPALVQNGRLDVLAANRLGRALFADVYDQADLDGRTGRLPNHARFTFLDQRAGDFYPDWNRVAADGVSVLRAEAGRNPDDRDLTELIGELTTRSEQFSALWATHNVRWHTARTQHLHHPVAGDLALAYEAMDLTADTGQTLITFTAAPGSSSQHALTFLASWATSPERTTAEQQPIEQNTPEQRARARPE
jgi:transcriptional regulator with XRE-family HTH domain